MNESIMIVSVTADSLNKPKSEESYERVKNYTLPT